MSVHWELTTVTLMLNVLTLLGASTVPATLALREMESTALVSPSKASFAMQHCHFSPTNFLLDINECELVGFNGCDVNAMCSDTIGSFLCMCNTGFTGLTIPGATCNGTIHMVLSSCIVLALLYHQV